MKTDRELLELAARAADIDGWYEPEYLSFIKSSGGPWNPLINDGDALRLAVGLRLTVRVWVNAVVIEDCAGNRLAYEDTGCRAPAYELEATRRAIVRAAAATLNA